jgi:hypothetical protein
MKLKITDKEDTFTKHSEVAYKDGKIYDVFISSRSYCMGSCLGRVRVIVENDNILQWVYPLTGAGNYELLDSTKMKRMRDMLYAYDNSRNC